MTIPYTMGYNQGLRNNPFLGSFFETSKEYLLYQQGYHNGQRDAHLDLVKHKELYEAVI